MRSKSKLNASSLEEISGKQLLQKTAEILSDPVNTKIVKVKQGCQAKEAQKPTQSL